MMPREQAEELDALARPLIKWMNDNLHPHHVIIVTNASVELSETQTYVPITDYIKD